MKVGDIVRHGMDGTLGFIVEVNFHQPCTIDLLFPYQVFFIDGDIDWFGIGALELVSEGR